MKKNMVFIPGLGKVEIRSKRKSDIERGVTVYNLGEGISARKEDLELHVWESGAYEVLFAGGDLFMVCDEPCLRFTSIEVKENGVSHLTVS